MISPYEYLYKYMEYQWVVMQPLLLLLYTYHGASIATWLK